jgi:hypothetical protein
MKCTLGLTNKTPKPNLLINTDYYMLLVSLHEYESSTIRRKKLKRYAITHQILARPPEFYLHDQCNSYARLKTFE